MASLEIQSGQEQQSNHYNIKILMVHQISFVTCSLNFCGETLYKNCQSEGILKAKAELL